MNRGQFMGIAAIGQPALSARQKAAVIVRLILAEGEDIDLARLAGRMAQTRIADLRNIHTPEVWRAAGFTAISGLGRPGRVDP